MIYTKRNLGIKELDYYCKLYAKKITVKRGTLTGITRE